MKVENLDGVSIPVGAVTVSGVIASVHPDLPEGIIDEVIQNYDPQLSKAPLTVSHEGTGKTSVASFGWVEKLKKVGRDLVAEMVVLPELADWLKKGYLKTRSVGIDENFDGKGKRYLHHLAFLGAQLPRIKGMPDLVFEEPNKPIRIVNFSEIKKGGHMPENEITLSAKQHDELVGAAVLKEKTKWDSEHADSIKKYKEEIGALKSQVTELTGKLTEKEEKIKEFAEAKTKTEVTSAIDEIIRQGRMEPKHKDGQIKDLIKIKEFSEDIYSSSLKRLQESPVILEFGEKHDAAGGPVGGNNATEKHVKREGDVTKIDLAGIANDAMHGGK